MVNINNRDDIFSRLTNLKADAEPLFGKLSPQQMVEHLYGTVMLSNGNYPENFCIGESEAVRLREDIIISANDFPMELKAPLMGEEPPATETCSLPQAIERLKEELEAFDNYFAQNKDAKPMNPITGALDRDEWIVFHNKHFTHHFKQYNLL
ncbi:MAG: DUF1569 domain-containing protein [Bacteroidota bacterium]